MVGPISDCIITDDFNLARPQCFVFIGIISFNKWIFRKNPYKVENFLLLRPTFRNGFEQFKMQINCVGGHDVIWNSNVSQIRQV